MLRQEHVWLRRAFGVLIGACIAALLALAPASVLADEEPEVLVPIPLADIPAKAASQVALLEQTETLLASTPVVDSIEDDLAAQERIISARLLALNASLAGASSREAISEIEQIWLGIGQTLEDWERQLRTRSSVIDRQLELVSARNEVWKMTFEQARSEDAPTEIVALARSTTERFSATTASLESMRDRTLALQGRLARSRSNVQDALDRAAAEETELLNNRMQREREPLWSEAVAGVSARELGARAMREMREWWAELFSLIRNETDRLVFQLLVLAGLTVVLHGSRKAARAWSAADPSVTAGMSVFERPLALATLITLLITPWLYVSTPPAVGDAVALLLIIPVIRLISPLLDAPIRPALYLLSTLYVVDRLRDLVEAAPLVARLVFLLEMLAAIGIAIWLMRSETLHARAGSANDTLMTKFVRFGLGVAIFLLVVATLATVAGFVRLAVLIGYGALNSAYLALLLLALIRAADAITALALHSRLMQLFKFVANRAAALRVRIRGLLSLAAVGIWIYVALDLFAVRDYPAAMLSAVLFSELRAGAIAVSLADVLAFAVTIFGAFLLARLVTLVLDEDVYSRVELGRGVPFAISAVVKYGVIALGFLLAVGAMGMGMDKITILLGALGVGLGFGLQNVVNNFVSGLILIFERPIQIGDSVEVGSVKGTVRRMGIRSSTIRSFDGADITIPNGTLLSDALTNWTMSDRTRRIDIEVGVAYGSKPDEVIAILHDALDGQEGLLEKPSPQVLFTGFGESSLDFVLRAWVADNDDFVRIRSGVALAVNRLLEENNIEIPFPQRDLHLRSAAPGTIPGAT